MQNIQLEVINETIAKLEALKAKTSPQTAYARPSDQVRDYRAAYKVAADANLIADLFKIDMVFGALDCLGLSITDDAENALLVTDAFEDAFYEADCLIEDWRDGAAA